MKTERIELRVEPELKARVVAEADRRGQKVATFVERALERALASVGSLDAAAWDAGPSMLEEKFPVPSATVPKLSVGLSRSARPVHAATCRCPLCRPVKG